MISILALLGIAWAWGIPFSRSAVNVRLVGLCLLTVVVAIVVDRVVLAATRTLERSKRLPANTVRMIRRWLRGAILLLGLVAMVGIAGWRIDSLVTFLTTLLAMVAIGFVAVWSILSNLLATLVILIWRPFNLGEEIELAPDGLSGRVVDINFMYTILRNEDDSQTSIPNSLFAQKFIKRKLIRHPPKRSLAEQLESTQALET